LIDPDAKDGFEEKIKKTLLAHHATDQDPRVIRTFSSTVQRPYESTGLEVKEAYFRQVKDGLWTSVPSGQVSKIDVEGLIKKAPVGSRISWTNEEADVTTGFHTENTIKLGADKFAAHGLKPVSTRAEIELSLAQKKNVKADGAYVKTHIFVSDIALFEIPGN